MPVNQTGGVRKYPLHRSPPAAPSSRANSSADPNHKVHGADLASGAGRSAAGTSGRDIHGVQSSGWVYGVTAAPSPGAAGAPGEPEPRRFCCFSGFGSSPHGRQLPAPTAACSLCIVRAREQEEGPREKREQEIRRTDSKKKKGNQSRHCSWGLEKRTLVACRHRPCLPTINIDTPATKTPHPWPNKRALRFPR